MRFLFVLRTPRPRNHEGLLRRSPVTVGRRALLTLAARRPAEEDPSALVTAKLLWASPGATRAPRATNVVAWLCQSGCCLFPSLALVSLRRKSLRGNDKCSTMFLGPAKTTLDPSFDVSVQRSRSSHPLIRMPRFLSEMCLEEQMRLARISSGIQALAHQRSVQRTAS